jgi:cytochrome b561
MPTGPTQPSSAPACYDRTAIALHWITFTLVVVVGVLGLLHDSWPDDTQARWINVHAVLGLILWVTLIARLAWRMSHPPPPLPPTAGDFVRRYSAPVHRALYALLVVTPLVGVITFIYHGRVFDLGLFQINPGIAKNRAVFRPTEEVHGYLAYAIFALAGLHAAAALWHQFYLRDGILSRMWPGRR